MYTAVSFHANVIFLDFQTHLPLSPITTGLIFPVRVSMESLLVVKTFSMITLSIPFLALHSLRYSKKNPLCYVSSQY